MTMNALPGVRESALLAQPVVAAVHQAPLAHQQPAPPQLAQQHLDPQQLDPQQLDQQCLGPQQLAQPPAPPSHNLAPVVNP